MTSEEHASIICLALPFGRVYPNVGADAFDNEDWAHLAYLFASDFDLSGVVSGPYRVPQMSVFIAGAKESAAYRAGAQEGQGEG